MCQIGHFTNDVRGDDDKKKTLNTLGLGGVLGGGLVTAQTLDIR